MNKVIANIFSVILSTINVVVIIGFVGVIGKYQSDKEAVVNILGNVAYDSGMFYGILFLVFLLYVLFVGLLSTFVAINEHLEEISSSLKKTPRQE